MRIGIIHLGDICNILISSSLNKGLLKQYKDADITWIVDNSECASIFQYTKNCKAVLASEFLHTEYEPFDILINLSPNVHPADPVLKYKEFIGFNGSEESLVYYEVIYGNRKTSMNPFQVYYRLAGMKWRGEGYGIVYYPKTRVKKDWVAVAIDRNKLRHYVNDNLVAKNAFRMLLLPYKKNVYRRMDEINRCSFIITDDLLTLHLSLFLRKQVHFLETFQLNSEPELFGNGVIYPVPKQIVI
jgi:hypothetical protein